MAYLMKSFCVTFGCSANTGQLLFSSLWHSGTGMSGSVLNFTTFPTARLRHTYIRKIMQIKLVQGSKGN